MKESKSQDKIMRVLKRMDEVLIRNGYQHYQERIHRIYKTMLSIERHGDCYVSNFTLEEGDLQDKETKFEENFTSNYLSVVTEDEIEIENEDKSVTKYELDDILSFIEDELNVQNLVSVADSTLASSSSEDEDEEEGKKKQQPVKKEKMQKKFFNIELRLRAYLKEAEMFRSPIFDSFLNDSKLRTPLSKLSPQKVTLPLLIKNFFEDKSIIEEARKRYSVREDLRNQISRLGNAEEIFKCRSNYDHKLSQISKPPRGIHKSSNDTSTISNFSVDSSDNSINNSNFGSSLSGNNVSSTPGNINFLKRDSIFKDKYVCNFGVVQEENNNEEDNFDNISDQSEDESCDE